MWIGVELREIRTFLTLADELHFGRTAERLRVTPSSVSQTIRTLEGRVGGRLFDRTSRRVRLTPVGERLLAGLLPAYQRLEQAFADASQAASGVSGSLRVGMYSRISCGPHWLEIVRMFNSRHPSCEVQLIDTGFVDYFELLRDGTVDVLAVRLPCRQPDVTVGPILSHEPRVLLVAKQDPLASRRSVCLEDFSDRRILDSPTLPREMTDAFLPRSAHGGRVFSRVQVRTLEEVLMLVAAGELVHPTVSSFLDFYAHDGVVSVPILDLPPSETALVWLRRNGSPKLAAFASSAFDAVARTDLAEYQPPTSLAPNDRSALPSKTAPNSLTVRARPR